MIFYHVDRRLSLRGVDLIDKHPIAKDSLLNFDSISEHGKLYLMDTPFQQFNGSCLWEFALEYVRATQFPQYVSRFQSVFAHKDINSAKKWVVKQFGKVQDDTANFKVMADILKIESDVFNEFDSGFLTADHIELPNAIVPASWSHYCYKCFKYWNKETAPNPDPEILVPLPCKIVERKTFILTRTTGIEEFNQ